MIFRAPTLDKGHPDGAHLGQLVHRLEAVVDRLGEQGGELLVVKDLQAAARRDLAHCGWVKAGEGCTLDNNQVLIFFMLNVLVVVIAVSRLHKDC